MLTFLLTVAAVCFGRVYAPAPCPLSLRLLAAETGQPCAGLVRITDSDGGIVSPREILSRGLGLPTKANDPAAIHQWSVINGPTTIELRPGRYTIQAVAGLERESARQAVELIDGKPMIVDLRLRRFSDRRSLGWYSGNTHLHLARLDRAQADRYLEEVPRSDDLDLVFLSYLERAGEDQTYISNVYRQVDLAKIGRRAGTRFGNGEEHRHNFGSGGEGFGHVMFLNLRELVPPVSIGPGIAKQGTDGIPLRRGIDAAHRQSACVLWCHNDWGRERLPTVVTGRLDAQNIFDGSIRSGYKDSFYRDLNAGFRVPFSTGTDWFIYDFSRVYALVRGEPTVANWLKSLASGRTFITNGPLLELTVDGHAIGDIVALHQPQTVRVEAHAVGRVDFKQIELIQNGTAILTAPSRQIGRHYEATISRELAMDSPRWLALRTPPPPLDNAAATDSSVGRNELGRPLFAHTSAIHVEFNGRRFFDKTVADGMLVEMQSNREMIARTGQFTDDQERARVLDVYSDGIAAIKKHIFEQTH